MKTAWQSRIGFFSDRERYLIQMLERPFHHQQLHRHQQISHQSHKKQLAHHHHLQEMSTLSANHHEGTSLDIDQCMRVLEYKCSPKNSLMYKKGKPTTSEEDEPSFTEDGTNSHLSEGKSKENSPWQRIKWTDTMARLLITAVLYVGEDCGPDYFDGSKRKSGILQKKGKWRNNELKLCKLRKGSTRFTNSK
ncbi:hypothetical protein SUGI_0394180 [Cryptomeria japonica]|nr:hypothetical protein SUGI_0394180 [Cryptomeria japonica]